MDIEKLISPQIFEELDVNMSKKIPCNELLHNNITKLNDTTSTLLCHGE